MSELRIERTYPIEPARLFAYVTETEYLVQWWGPEGTTATEVSLNLARLGPWSLVLEGPRGAFAMRGDVKKVTPPSLVEFTLNVPGVEAGESLVRFEIAPDGEGGSRFTLIQSGISDAMVEMGRRGWGSTIARLEAVMGVAGR